MMPEALDNYPRTIGERRAEVELSRGTLVSAIESARTAGFTADGWSVAQIAYHLYLTEDSVVRMLSRSLASSERGEIATEERLIEEWERLRSLVGRRTMKAQSPTRVVPNDAPTIDEVLRLLAESRRALLGLIAGTDAVSLASIYGPHPLKAVGTLAGLSWLSMIAFHELRHSEQVREGIAR